MTYPLCIKSNRPSFNDYHNAQVEVIMSLPMPKEAGYEEYGLSDGACNLWRALLDLWNAHPNLRNKNPFTIKRTILGRYLKIRDEDTISKYTQELVKAGYIEWTRPTGRNDGGIYTLYSPIAIRDGIYIDDEFDTEKIGVKDDDSSSLTPKKSVSSQQQDTDSQPKKSVSNDTFFNIMKKKKKKENENENENNIPPYPQSDNEADNGGDNSSFSDTFELLFNAPTDSQPGVFSQAVMEAIANWEEHLQTKYPKQIPTTELQRTMFVKSVTDKINAYGEAGFIDIVTNSIVDNRPSMYGRPQTQGNGKRDVFMELARNKMFDDDWNTSSHGGTATGKPVTDKPIKAEKEKLVPVSFEEAERRAEAAKDKQEEDEEQLKAKAEADRFREAMAEKLGGKIGGIW